MKSNINQLYLDFIKENKWTYVVYILLLLSYPVEKIYVPQMYGNIITQLEKVTEVGIFIPLIIVWILIQLVRIGLTKLDGVLTPKFEDYVRHKIVNKFINSLETDYREVNHGDFLTKLIKIPWALNELFDQYKELIFINLLLLVSLVAYFFKQNKKLGIILTGSLLVYGLFIYMFYKDCKDVIYKKETLYDGLHEHIQDVLNNSVAMFAYQQKDFENAKLDKIHKEYIDVQNKSSNCSLKWKVLFTILVLAIFIVINLYIFNLYQKKEMEGSVVVSIFIIMYSLIDRLMDGHYDALNYISSLGVIDEVYTYLDSLTNTEYKKGNRFKNGDITFKNMTFKYKNASKNLFDKFNLKIKQGDKIAIVGHIGSGKSTLIKLLMRYNEIQSGGVYIGGQPIKDTDIIALRSGISYVPQNTVLFNRTLYENITYGADTNKVPKDEDILKIFDDLGMDDLKIKFKERMHKSVGKNGGELSGGQRQIVWLLRAFLSNKQIIIIDEPTSSLDPESKTYVIKMINKLFDNRTVLVVTHDKEIIKAIDNVVELKEGKIV